MIIYKPENKVFTNRKEAKEYFGTNNNKYDTTNNDKEYLIEYYNYIISLENPTLLSVANDLKISKDTVCKRNKKLREMGYTLPFKSKKN